MRRVVKILMALLYSFSPLLVLPLNVVEPVLYTGPTSLFLALLFFVVDDLTRAARILAVAWSVLMLAALLVGTVLLAFRKNRLFLIAVGVDTAAVILVMLVLLLGDPGTGITWTYVLSALWHIGEFIFLRHWFHVLDTYE